MQLLPWHSQTRILISLLTEAASGCTSFTYTMGQTRYNVDDAAACGIITQAETVGVLKKTADLDSGPLTFSITASMPAINCFLQHIRFAKKGGSITSDLQLAEYGAMSTFAIHVMSGENPAPSQPSTLQSTLHLTP